MASAADAGRATVDVREVELASAADAGRATVDVREVGKQLMDLLRRRRH